MKIITRFESAWNEALQRYVTVNEESFDYDGPVARCDPVEDVVKMAGNHIENVGKGYKEDPERALLGINTSYEGKLWGSILGKDYEPLVGDLIMEGSPYTQKDFQTAEAKGIDTGTVKTVDSIARIIAIYYAGSAAAGALGAEAALGGGATELGVGFEAGGGATAGEGLLVGETAAGAGVGGEATTLAEGQAGISTSGSETLASNPTNDSLAGSNIPAETVGQPEQLSGPGGPKPATTPAKGLIQSGLDFAKEHPLLTLGAGQLASGVVQGIGSNITQNQIADKKAQNDKDLLAQKTEEERKILEARRQFVQGGSYFSTPLPVRPGPKQPLRRPDGSLVYAPNGLIASAIK